MVPYRTAPGLKIRCVGENPDGAYARGIDPDRVQLLYAVAGGMMVGIAGAAFSLCVKPGWGQPQGCEGSGWIALALVIFGGWHPVKAAAGAYLFAFLQVMSIHLQAWYPGIPAQVFQVAPFPLMIFILVLISLAQQESVLRLAGTTRPEVVVAPARGRHRGPWGAENNGVGRDRRRRPSLSRAQSSHCTAISQSTGYLFEVGL